MGSNPSDVVIDPTVCYFYRNDFIIEKDGFRGDRLFLEYLDIMSKRDIRPITELDIADRVRSLAQLRNLIKIIAHPKCDCDKIRRQGLDLMLSIIVMEAARLFDYYTSIKHQPLNDIIESIKELHTKKNHDYATGLGSDALANFMFVAVMKPRLPREYDKWEDFYDIGLGFIWRMADKVSRMITFSKKGELLVENDSYEDAVRDYLVYLGLFYAFIKRVSLLLRSSEACSERSDT